MYPRRRRLSRTASFNRVRTASSSLLRQLRKIASPQEIHRKYKSIISQFMSDKYDAMDDDINDTILDPNEKKLGTLDLRDLVELKTELTEAVAELNDAWNSAKANAPKIKAMLQREMDSASEEDLEVLEEYYDEIQTFLRNGHPLAVHNPYAPFLVKIDEEIDERRTEGEDDAKWRRELIGLIADFEDSLAELEVMDREIRTYPDLRPLKMVKVDVDMLLDTTGLGSGFPDRMPRDISNVNMDTARASMAKKRQELLNIQNTLPSVHVVERKLKEFEGGVRDRNGLIRRAKEVDAHTWQMNIGPDAEKLKGQTELLEARASAVRAAITLYLRDLKVFTITLAGQITRLEKVYESSRDVEINANLASEREIKYLKSSLRDIQTAINRGVRSSRDLKALTERFEKLEAQAEAGGSSVVREVANQLRDTKKALKEIVVDEGLMGKFRGLFSRKASYEYMAEMNRVASDMGYMGSDMDMMSDDLEADMDMMAHEWMSDDLEADFMADDLEADMDMMAHDYMADEHESDYHMADDLEADFMADDLESDYMADMYVEGDELDAMEVMAPRQASVNRMASRLARRHLRG
jgi:hypothetical protein